MVSVGCLVFVFRRCLTDPIPGGQGDRERAFLCEGALALEEEFEASIGVEALVFAMDRRLDCFPVGGAEAIATAP